MHVLGRIARSFVPLFWCLLVGVSAAKGQQTFRTIDELILAIQSQPDDSALDAFLVKQGLFSHDVRRLGGVVEHSDPDSIRFHRPSLILEDFKKNLFGGPEEEIVLQLRDEKVVTIHVFAVQGKSLRKVPGFISHVFGEEPLYFDQSFNFHFEEIAAQNVYSILTDAKWSYERSVTESVTLWHVSKDSITQLLSFDAVASSYSGQLTYSYNTERKYSLEPVDSFPKRMVIIAESQNEEDMEYDAEGNPVAGTLTTIRGVTTTYFTYQKGMLRIADTQEKVERNTERLGDGE